MPVVFGFQQHMVFIFMTGITVVMVIGFVFLALLDLCCGWRAWCARLEIEHDWFFCFYIRSTDDLI